MVFWPLGLPRLSQSYHERWLRRPEARFSPDRKLLALADAWLEAPPIAVSCWGTTSTVQVAGARLVVYEARTRKPVWKLQLPPKPPKLPEHGPMINPAPMPWTSAKLAFPRWSADGRHLVYTKHGYAGEPEGDVVEVGTWKQVVQVEGAVDGFLVGEEGRR